MRPTLPSTPSTVLGGRGDAPTPDAAADLERFWPGRRAHAFDEFCR